MSQHLFRCVYAYKVNISRARQQRNRWPKQIFFGEVTLLPHLFCRPRAVYLFVRRLFGGVLTSEETFSSSHTLFFLCRRHIFLGWSSRQRGPGICGCGVWWGAMTTTGLIYKMYIGPKSSFFEKNDKKSSKMFARFEIMPTFASAITKTVLLSLETNVAKVPTDAGSKSNFEKSFRKSS